MGRVTGTFVLIAMLMAGAARAGIVDAQAALDTKDYVLAIQLASEGLKQPGLSTAVTNSLRMVRGKARFAGNQFNDAIGDFTFVIEDQLLAPGNDCKRLSDAYLARGQAYFRTIKYPAAAEDFRHVLACEPDNAVAYFNLGQAYSGEEMTDKAIESYSAAIRLKPDYAEAYGARAPSYQNKEEYEAALADYNEAIRLEPKTARYYGNRATIFKHTKRFDQAAADLDNAISLDPDDYGSYLNRAELHIQRNEFDLASADFESGKKLLNVFYDKYPEERDDSQFKSFMADWLTRIENGLAAGKETSSTKAGDRNHD